MALLLPLLNPLKSTARHGGGAAARAVHQPRGVPLRQPGAAARLGPAADRCCCSRSTWPTAIFVEARGKRQITGLFGQYVPPELVDEMARNPEQLQHGAASRGDDRCCSPTCADSRRFPKACDPKDAVAVYMNEFLTPLTEVIYESTAARSTSTWATHHGVLGCAAGRPGACPQRRPGGARHAEAR